MAGAPTSSQQHRTRRWQPITNYSHGRWLAFGQKLSPRDARLDAGSEKREEAAEAANTRTTLWRRGAVSSIAPRASWWGERILTHAVENRDNVHAFCNFSALTHIRLPCRVGSSVSVSSVSGHDSIADRRPLEFGLDFQIVQGKDDMTSACPGLNLAHVPTLFLLQIRAAETTSHLLLSLHLGRKFPVASAWPPTLPNRLQSRLDMTGRSTTMESAGGRERWAIRRAIAICLRRELQCGYI
ncbi:hypothetical protein ANO11243_075320 [Dothideomycetidae sp. 11243]|nr:hypothetical protein ANO11243_075320 [fungal sp. No.11243]